MLLKFMELTIKHRDKWPTLAEIGRLNRLSIPEIILLMAILEVESGSEGNEFNCKRVQDTDFAMQANGMANLIRSAEYQYQRYVKGLDTYLKVLPNNKPVSFQEFFRYPVITNEVGSRDQKWLDKIGQFITVIDKEFSKQGEKDGH